MRAIRSVDTKPEIAVRRLLTLLGYRYRVHKRSLPGSPDVVFTGRRKAILVNGCFWHQHQRCSTHFPETRIEFWSAKLEGNRRRDRANLAELKRIGWKALVIWECELKNPDRVRRRITGFLGPPRSRSRIRRRPQSEKFFIVSNFITG
jgi:DNA mismatch endonuclease Vsr